jgi:putative Mn2+ efflux pump MntP
MEFFDLILAGVVGFTLLCILGLTIYVVVLQRQTEDKINDKQKQIDKIVQYIRFYDKLIFQLYDVAKK